MAVVTGPESVTPEQIGLPSRTCCQQTHCAEDAFRDKGRILWSNLFIIWCWTYLPCLVDKQWIVTCCAAESKVMIPVRSPLPCVVVMLTIEVALNRAASRSLLMSPTQPMCMPLFPISGLNQEVSLLVSLSVISSLIMSYSCDVIVQV